MRVAVQGVRGCFSHQALTEFMPGAEAIFCERAEETREALREGRVEGVLLPVENSLAGVVREHAELVERMCGEDGARVAGEHRMAIRQQLIGVPGATVEGLRRVYSHPVALKQCGEFFAERPGVSAEEYFDTAGSVARVMEEGDMAQAAIGGRLAAEEYGAMILLADIHDRGNAGARGDGLGSGWGGWEGGAGSAEGGAGSGGQAGEWRRRIRRGSCWCWRRGENCRWANSVNPLGREGRRDGVEGGPLGVEGVGGAGPVNSGDKGRKTYVPAWLGASHWVGAGNKDRIRRVGQGGGAGALHTYL